MGKGIPSGAETTCQRSPSSSSLSSPAGSPLRASEGFLRRRALWGALAGGILFVAAAASVFVTLGIVYVLITESTGFFAQVSLVDFLTDTQWTPVFENARFGVMTLVSATLTVAGIALAVSIPAGLALAIYLSEFARGEVRETVKPFLELLEGVPTVVYGYFTLLFFTPLLQTFIPGLEGFNMLGPGIVMGIMILPYTASVSEDAMRAVPTSSARSRIRFGLLPVPGRHACRGPCRLFRHHGGVYSWHVAGRGRNHGRRYRGRAKP